MPNMNSAIVDTGVVAMGENLFQDAYIKFTAAGTLKAGTILARDTSATGKYAVYVPFVKGGTTNGNGVPSAVLNSDIEATGAGNVMHRVLNNGMVRGPRLIIAADGNATNVDAAVRDGLRDYGIVVMDVNQLSSTLDNR